MELYYRGQGQKRAAAGALPKGKLLEMTAAAGYRAEPGLLKAVHVALTLGQPLLLTGEPGSGKSQLAHSIAYELGLGEALVFETKSISQGRDLFYHFDSLSFFRSGRQDGASLLPFVHFNALGKAILRAHPHAALRAWLKESDADAPPSRSVVLIDEVDKAPRDFPNDILNELEQLYFRIPELMPELKALQLEQVKAEQELAPILILTSNSENDLPDAFLRRCVYYDLPFPEAEQLGQIIAARVPQFAGTVLGESGLAFFQALRGEGLQLQKKPACSELLCWFLLLHNWGWNPNNELKSYAAQVPDSLHCLAKTRADHERVREFWHEWQGKQA